MASSCSSNSLQVPSLSRASITGFNINLVENYNFTASTLLYYRHPTVMVKDATFYNITITYAHTNANDMVHVGEGYATTTTNAGLTQRSYDFSPDLWALTSEGLPNTHALQDLTSVSLNDQLIMEWINYFPYPCKLNALINTAIKAYNKLDGIKDGIIVDDSTYDFDPSSVISMPFFCADTNTTRTMANTASQLSSETLDLTNDIGPAMMRCSSNSTCAGVSLGLGNTNIIHEEFDRDVRESVRHYDPIIGTNDPDLTAFYHRGGKILSYHGMIDQPIPVKGSEHYYDRVTEVIPQVDEFFRIFEVPGFYTAQEAPAGNPATPLTPCRPG
ncbi:hypothetical protein S40288_10299 [Stachybotrys chartarum IBT 40288]|nr:hypothetical protein S40288_10299 [Stachybotrys chartarum IBT 40288]